MKRILLGVVLGLAMGLPGGWFALAELGPQLGFDGSVEVAGVVEARRVEADRVQLMLRAADGESVLATFTERPEDVAALARVGDTVVLSLTQASPIVDDPTISRVEPAGEERPDPFGDPRAEAEAEGGAEDGEAEDRAADDGEADEAATDEEANDGETADEAAADEAADDEATADAPEVASASDADADGDAA